MNENIMENEVEVMEDEILETEPTEEFEETDLVPTDDEMENVPAETNGIGIGSMALAGVVIGAAGKLGWELAKLGVKGAVKGTKFLVKKVREAKARRDIVKRENNVIQSDRLDESENK